MLLNHAYTHYDQSDLPLELRLGARMAAYVATLTRQASGFIEFRTGAGRIFRDLMLHWPTLDGWEDEAHDLCERIADAVYPLTSALFAQGVDMQIAISPAPLPGPEHIDALATYVVFDRQACCERRFFLSPRLPLPASRDMRIEGGIAVLCRPLHYRYHTLKDDRQKKAHPRVGMFELPQRMINEMYDAPDFVPHERQLIASIAAQIAALPLRLRQSRETIPPKATATQERAPAATTPLRLVTALSALPPPVRAVERRLMTAATDKRAYTPPLRAGLRRVAQGLRNLYPVVLIDEAARQETARRAALPVMRTFFAAPEFVEKEDKRRADTPHRAKTVKPDLARRADLLQREYTLPPAVLAEAKTAVNAEAEPLRRALDSWQAADRWAETPKKAEQKTDVPQIEKEPPRAAAQESPKANKEPEKRESPKPESRAEEKPERKPQEPSATQPKAERVPDVQATFDADWQPDARPSEKIQPPREAARAVLKNENAAKTPTAPAPPAKSLWRRWLSVPTLAPLPLVSRLFGRK